MTFYHQQVLKIKAEVYPSDSLVQQVINAKIFMDMNFTGRINTDDMAREAFYSKFHFIRVFKNCYGRTPHQYLRELKIKKAKDLIKSGMPVTDACLLVGFESIGSFSSLFKKIVGFPPSRFRALKNKQPQF